MLAAAETDNGTIFSLMFTAFGLVASLYTWARWQAKQTSDTHAVSTGTLREVIGLLKTGQQKLEAEIAALRVVQTTQAEQIATLKEKVRQLESQRDALLAENNAQKTEIVALNVRIVEQQAEILRLQTALAKAVEESQIQEALNERLNQRLTAHDKKAGGIVGA